MMMTTLYLMRHGIAEDGFDIADEARQLTDEGRRKTTAIARALHNLDVTFTHVLASPLVRAQQTAELVAAEFDPAPGIEAFEPLCNGHVPEDVLASLAPFRGASSLLLVGHQPSLGDLAGYLLTSGASSLGLPFKKGAVAAIRVGSLPPRAPGELLWFVPPRLWLGNGGSF